MDEQTLREIYARHFRMVVQDGGVGSVMASYNLVNGDQVDAERAHADRRPARRLRLPGLRAQRLVGDAQRAMPTTADTGTLKTNAVEAVHAGLDVELPWGFNYGQLENIVATRAAA